MKFYLKFICFILYFKCKINKLILIKYTRLLKYRNNFNYYDYGKFKKCISINGLQKGRT